MSFTEADYMIERLKGLELPSWECSKNPLNEPFHLWKKRAERKQHIAQALEVLAKESK